MNTDRLIKVLKWNIITNKRQLGRMALGLIAGFIIVAIVTMQLFWRNKVEVQAYEVQRLAAFYIAASGFVMLYSAARLNWNMLQKNDIINYLMLPATKTEKYLANLIYQIVLPVIGLAIAFLVSDVVQMILSYSITDAYYSHTLKAFHLVREFFDEQNMLNAIVQVALMILTHAFYAFGGTFFRRHNALLTTLCAIAIPLTLSAVIGFSGAALVKWLEANDYIVTIEWLVGDTFWNWVTLFICAALTCLFYWASYRYFCRAQVINNRFKN